MSKQGRDLARTQRAAAIRAAQERKERNRRIALIVGIVVALGAIVAAGAWYGGGGGTSSNAPTTVPVSAGTTSLYLGKKSAPVKVVIYEDFQCPICRELESSTRAFLRENAEKGKVYVEYQPIHLLAQYPYSEKALNAWAAVLHNSSPASALKLHDLLYDNQPYEQSSGQVTDSQIAGWVKEAGADDADVRAAMGSTDAAFFSAVDKIMLDLKIDGTPTVSINGKVLPRATVPTYVSQIENAVDQG